MKTIRITCKTGYEEYLENLQVLQGDLKDLSAENYEKLKKEILTEGFDAPFFTWEEKPGLIWILDGTQRHRVLTKMSAEKYLIPFLPIVPILAETMAEAKRKLLGYASQYGSVTSQGLYEFMSTAEIPFDEMDARFRFPEIKNEEFKDEFYADPVVEGEDDVPEVKETFVKSGDLFILDGHRLVCGDASDINNRIFLRLNEKVEMIYTDPPYGIGFESTFTKPEGALGGRKLKQNHFEILHGDDGFKNFDPRYILDIDCDEIFLWGADNYCWHLPKTGGWICWDKTGGHENLDNIPGSSFELCWSNHSHKRHIIPLTWRGAFGHNKKNDGDEKVHPTQKPVSLAEWFLNKWAKDKKNIFDFYGGSGSTLIACEKQNKKCFMMEIDPNYCAVIIERWQKFSGKQAYRQETDGSMTSYDELKATVDSAEKSA